MKIKEFQPMDDDFTIIFTNGGQMDYTITDYDDKKPHRLSIGVGGWEESPDSESLTREANDILAMAWIKTLMPEAYMETIYDEVLEYIIYLTDEELQKLKDTMS